MHVLPGVDLRDDEVEAVRLQFLQEMEILSFLRHPNLLLFIGVSFDPATRTPLWIITELMQHSIYSILHEMRLELTVAEIVDVAVGIVSGLQVRPEHRDCCCAGDLRVARCFHRIRLLLVGYHPCVFGFVWRGRGAAVPS